MGEGITITPDKVIFHIWNKEEREIKDRIVDPINLPRYSWEEVELEGDISLGRIVELVVANAEEWETILCENIKPLLEEAQKPLTEKEEEGEMSFLEVHWSASSQSFKKEKTFSIWPSFHGVGFALEDDKYGCHKKGDRVNYGVEFTPMNYLVKYPIKIDDKVSLITDDLDSPKLREGHQDLGNKRFTLLDLFKAIFWELTFAGTPEQRDDLVKDLNQQVEDIKSGKAELIPWEEVKEKLA